MAKQTQADKFEDPWIFLPFHIRRLSVHVTRAEASALGRKLTPAIKLA
jgi:hypothetical protein